MICGRMERAGGGRKESKEGAGKSDVSDYS